MNQSYKLYGYTNYSSINEPWFNKIPSHWNLVRTKFILQERTTKGFPDEPMLAATQTKGVVRKEDYDNRTVLALKDLHLLKLVKKDDFVISLRSFQGGIEFAREQGIISPAYTVLFSKDRNNQNYLARLFKSKPYIENLTLYVTGIRQGQNIDYEKLSRSVIPLPPLEEQNAIVRFLDYTDRRIKRYIRAKQKLIKLLEEEKQAIIHQAVTRGLNPDVPMKPSRVEWLGEFPYDWEILPLKRWVSTKITDGPHETPVFYDDGVPFLSAESMVNGHFDFNHKRGYISFEAHDIYTKKCHPRLNDIFMCKSGATTGKVAIVETNQDFSVWSPLALIRVDKSRVLPHLLYFILQSNYIQSQIQTTWSYGTQPNLSMAAMERILVAIPPFDQQLNLLDYLNRSTKIIDNYIYKITEEIKLVSEYRTRLFADVVTGRLDVREAAAQLPEELEEDVEIEEPEVEDEEEVQEELEP